MQVILCYLYIVKSDKLYDDSRYIMYKVEFLWPWDL